MVKRYYLGMLFSFVDVDGLTMYGYSIPNYMMEESAFTNSFIHGEYNRWAVSFRLAHGVDSCTMVYANVYDSRSGALSDLLRVKLTVL
jgi:hypothetical protein